MWRPPRLLAALVAAGLTVEAPVRAQTSAAGDVPAYTSLDARIAWRPRGPVELAAVGQNLLEPHHREFGAQQVEARRGVYGTITWRP